MYSLHLILLLVIISHTTHNVLSFVTTTIRTSVHPNHSFTSIIPSFTGFKSSESSFLSMSIDSTTSGEIDSGSSSSRKIPNVYPISRKLLIEKAKDIDPSIARGESKGSYSTVGWSNRLGTVLTPASIPGVYTSDRPFYWNKIDVGCRMTIIQLQPQPQDNQQQPSKPDLWIHSPVFLDPPLKQALDKLGTVKHVVSPNYEHVKYAKMWSEAYPNANIWGCPGLMEMKKDVRWTGEIPYGCRPPGYPTKTKGSRMKPINSNTMWDWEEIQPMHFDVELNPFTQKPFFNEVVFFHSPSNTLICTDTYWNYPKGDGIANSNYDGTISKEEDFGSWELAPTVDRIPLGSRLWKFGMDQIYKPFYLNLMIQGDESRDEFRNIASFVSGLSILSSSSSSSSSSAGWDVQTIIPAHGDIVRGGNLTKNILKSHFNL